MFSISKKGILFAFYYTNFQNIDDLDYDILAISVDIAKDGLPDTDKPIMICGENINSEFVKSLDRECIISYVTEKNYKQLIPAIIEGGHYVVLKTPIDINLAKELNILAIEMGLSRDKIIMNTDIGGLGYGYEYGYSIMEKIVQERNNDEYLDFPLISEAPLESLKTKEAKSLNIIGDQFIREKMIELTAASGAFAAGANIVVIKNPESIDIMKGLI